MENPIDYILNKIKEEEKEKPKPLEIKYIRNILTSKNFTDEDVAIIKSYLKLHEKNLNLKKLKEISTSLEMLMNYKTFISSRGGESASEELKNEATEFHTSLRDLLEITEPLDLDKLFLPDEKLKKPDEKHQSD